MPACAHRLQTLQRLCDVRRLVERRDDDRDQLCCP
jgi:hypothetical protein